jgi:rubredoxin
MHRQRLKESQMGKERGGLALTYNYKCSSCGNQFKARLGVYSPETALRAHWNHMPDTCPKCGSVNVRETSTWWERWKNFLIAYNST